MKTIFRLLTAALLIAIAAAVSVATANPLVGLLVASGTAVALQYATGVSLLDLPGVASCTALLGIKRKCQNPTMGGAKRLYLVLAEDILNEFLTYEIAKTAGKFAGVIPLVTGKKFVEIEAWYDTTKFDTEMKTGGGFTQSVEFKILGYYDEVVKLMALLYETPVNVIVQGNDDKLYYLGQKYIPLMFDAKGMLPEKGTARKEVTFTAKNDGFTVPVFPLDATATFDVTPLAVV